MIIIWTGPGCSRCHLFMEHLKKHCIEFEVRDATTSEGFVYLSKKKCRPMQLPIVESNNRFFKTNEIFGEDGKIKKEWNFKKE